MSYFKEEKEDIIPSGVQELLQKLGYGLTLFNESYRSKLESIHDATFGDPPNTWQKLEKNRYCFVLVDNNQHPLGYARFRLEEKEGNKFIYLHHLVIDDSQRKKDWEVYYLQQ